MNQKRLKFVHHYTSDECFLNGTQAAIKAGYSPKTAKVQGSRLLTYADVRALVEKRVRESLEKTDMLTAQWLKKVKMLIDFDMREVATWGADGVRFKQSDEISDEAAYAITEIGETVTKDGGSIKLKTVSKDKALDMLGKFLALYTENRVNLTPGDATLDMGRKERQARIAELNEKRDPD